MTLPLRSFADLSALMQPGPIPGPAKTILSCCGYTALLGLTRDWQCPGCGATISPAA